MYIGVFRVVLYVCVAVRSNVALQTVATGALRAENPFKDRVVDRSVSKETVKYPESLCRDVLKANY